MVALPFYIWWIYGRDWCFWTVVLEKTLGSPLDSKVIKPVNPKENQSWISIGRTDADVEAPKLWPSDAKNWLTGKTLMLGKIEGRRRREQQRMRWHHRLNGLEFEQALWVGDGQRGLTRCSPWGHKKSDTTERLDWTDGREIRISVPQETLRIYGAQILIMEHNSYIC